jgi:hypothetical protein
MGAQISVRPSSFSPRIIFGRAAHTLDLPRSSKHFHHSHILPDAAWPRSGSLYRNAHSERGKLLLGCGMRLVLIRTVSDQI